MSNTVRLRKMSFTDADGTVTWGWCLEDNYASIFNDSMEQVDLDCDDLSLLYCVVQTARDDEQTKDLLQGCLESEDDMIINGNFYKFCQLQPTLEKL